MAIDRHVLSTCLSKDIQTIMFGVGGALSSAQVHACHALHKGFLSKDRDDPDEMADDAALQVFMGSNERCGAWAPTWESEEDLELISAFQREVDSFFFNGPNYWLPSLYDCLDHGVVGSGSSIDGGDTAFYAKFFSSVLTHSSPLLYETYRIWIEKLPMWTSAEKIRENTFGSADQVTSSRLSFAPKKRTISRTICIEPTLNSFMQLGLADCMNERLKRRWGYDPAYQPEINRELARQGSIDGRFSTIDLSSASDSVSLQMIRKFFPKGFVDLLCQLRLASVEIPGMSEPTELHMVSSMGNGFTFPLETMLFSMAVRAVYRINDIPIVNPDITIRKSLGPLVNTSWLDKTSQLPNWSVFGDDIIVVTDAARHVLRLLELLGFLVNRDKTFVEGPFRESCGEDYHEGVNIRPVYLKTTKNAASVYSIINNLNHWSARVSIPLTETVQFLWGQVCPRPVPPFEGKEAGVKMSSFLAQRVIDRAVRDGRVPKKAKNLRRKGLWSYQALRPETSSYKLGDRIIEMRPDDRVESSKTLAWNPDGLLVAILHGGIADNKITVRSKNTVYRPKRVTAPQWDWYVPSTLSWTDGVTWQQLDAAIECNLGYID